MWVGGLWLVNYFIYCTRVTVIGAACTYYWSSKPPTEAGLLLDEEEGQPELWTAIKITHWYHSGSIIFGSFVIGFLSVVSSIFMRMFRYFESFGDENAGSKFCSDYGTCLVSCFENFTDYCNFQSFAYMINTGENFCNSSYLNHLLFVKQGMTFEKAINLTD